MGLKAAVIPVTPFQQNCALLWDEDTGKGVVVDPGGDVDRILAAVAETGAAVERILLTHGHMDHAGGAADLRGALAQGPPAPPPTDLPPHARPTTAHGPPTPPDGGPAWGEPALPLTD